MSGLFKLLCQENLQRCIDLPCVNNEELEGLAGKTAKLGPRPGTGYRPGGDSQTLRKETLPLTLIEGITVENGKALIGMSC